MASVDVAFSSPLLLIRSLYDENPEILKKLEEVGKYFRVVVDDEISKIPCVNDISLDGLKPNSLVRYRGMIQDMFDPEFYLGKYEATNKHTKEKVQQLGCYTDTGHNQDEEIDFNTAGNITLERHTFYCVPVPGENQWVKDMHSHECIAMDTSISHSLKDTVDDSSSKNKRSLEEDEDDHNIMDGDNLNNISVSRNTVSTDEKRAKSNQLEDTEMTNSSPKPNSKNDFTKNFPLPNEKGPACLMKIYSNGNELKLNDVVEFVCILSVDPVFAVQTMCNGMVDQDMMIHWPEHNSVEEQAHCPPPSLVPRLHCIFFNKLKHLNLHIQAKDAIFANASKELSLVRADLMQLLTQVFGGDSTVAEYFLLHLISNVYGRCGTMCVGKLSLNLTKCPSTKFVQQLYRFIEQIVEKSYYLPLTLENLNNLKFIPRKDYEANRLTAGILQLSTDTYLILDETQMQTGKLDSDGVHNITAVGNLIQWQKVEYDFKFSKVDMETNVNVLVLSEGKSMLKCDCQLPLVSTEVQSEQLDALITNLAPKLLEKIRIYLSVVRAIEYNLTDEIQKALEDDFVEMRKLDSKLVNADSFYLLLTTARYMALSYGQNTLSAALWTRTKELDDVRRKRVS